MTSPQGGRAVYIIAEAGINHGGDIAVARQLVAQAAAAGVDAVKFQSFNASGLAHATLAADQHAFFKLHELSRAEHAQLAAACKQEGIDFLSTPFDFEAVEMLAALEMPAFKIASCDLDNLPLIRACASQGRPLYISTGMGELSEVRAAAQAALDAGAPAVTLLQCTTNYPTAYPDVELAAITALRELAATINRRLGRSNAAGPVSAGFSDHSIGNWCCFAAVALGAQVIEKHLCLDKAAAGPDIACSCDPLELRELVQGIRALEQALGSGSKTRLDSERAVAQIARRGVYYSRALPAGHVIEASDLCFLRPASGLSPAQCELLIGRALACAVRPGEAAALEQLADTESAVAASE
jgi:sialic acid synthase SpsE